MGNTLDSKVVATQPGVRDQEGSLVGAIKGR